MSRTGGLFYLDSNSWDEGLPGEGEAEDREDPRSLRPPLKNKKWHNRVDTK